MVELSPLEILELLELDVLLPFSQLLAKKSKGTGKAGMGQGLSEAQNVDFRASFGASFWPGYHDLKLRGCRQEGLVAANKVRFGV